jgi:hypothetical protein
MRWEGSVGLYKSDTRDYSPTLGRWTGQDIAYFDGPNLYEAMVSSPSTRVDPSGLLAPRDQRFGKSKRFWDWYHKQVKQKGDPDLTKEDADDYEQEWEDQGKPDGEGKTEKEPQSETTEPQSETESGNAGQSGQEGGAPSDDAQGDANRTGYNPATGTYDPADSPDYDPTEDPAYDPGPDGGLDFAPAVEEVGYFFEKLAEKLTELATPPKGNYNPMTGVSGVNPLGGATVTEVPVRVPVRVPVVAP